MSQRNALNFSNRPDMLPAVEQLSGFMEYFRHWHGG